jgi:glycosyltransferase involved in cell wall biosynthesis
MNKPKILHVIHSTAFGGGPNMLAILCLRLAGEFDMEVVSDGEGDVPGRLESAGIAVHGLDLTSKWSFARSIPRLAGLVRSVRPDLVHLHGQFAGSLGQLALAGAGRPRSVYHVQWPSFLDDAGPWSRLRNRVAEMLSCGRATAVVAVSESDRTEYLRRKLCPPEKISVIHNAYAVELDRMPAPPPPDGQVVGFVGRLSDQKGVEYLIRAAPGVLANHPAAKFVLVGDGPERVHLEELARSLGIASAIEFAGYQAQPSEWIKRSSVIAIPSIYDPFPLVTLEVMALARPVIASAVGGLPEAVEDGRTGILVSPRDPEALANAIGRLLDAPELCSQMGEAARTRARERFSPDAISAQFAALYRRLLV